MDGELVAGSVEFQRAPLPGRASGEWIEAPGWSGAPTRALLSRSSRRGPIRTSKALPPRKSPERDANPAGRSPPAVLSPTRMNGTDSSGAPAPAFDRKVGLTEIPLTHPVEAPALRRLPGSGRTPPAAGGIRAGSFPAEPSLPRSGKASSGRVFVNDSSLHNP